MLARMTDALRHAGDLLACGWTGVLDLGLVAWVARSSVGLLAAGFLLLSFAPQAQDLLIPLVDSADYPVARFFPLVFLLWSMPTHYAARLALDDDERLEQYRQRRKSKWLEGLLRHGPRLLGALTFIAFLICAYRGRTDFPVVLGEDENVRKVIFAELSWFMAWCVVWFATFLLYEDLLRPLLVAPDPCAASNERSRRSQRRCSTGSTSHRGDRPSTARTISAAPCCSPISWRSWRSCCSIRFSLRTGCRAPGAWRWSSADGCRCSPGFRSSAGGCARR